VGALRRLATEAVVMNASVSQVMYVGCATIGLTAGAAVRRSAGTSIDAVVFASVAQVDQAEPRPAALACGDADPEVRLGVSPTLSLRRGRVDGAHMSVNGVRARPFASIAPHGAAAIG